MPGQKKSILLGGALLIGATLVAGLAWMLRATDSDDGEVLGIGGASSSRPTRPATSPGGNREGGGTRLTEIPKPRLSVIPVSASGLPLLDAKIVATGPAGEREATGRATWDDVELGDWVIVVSDEGYLDFRQELTIIDGAQPELVITMHDSVTIRGKLIDSTGGPVSGISILFDREGARVPLKGKFGRARSNTRGEFEAMLGAASGYLITVGERGSRLLRSDEAIPLKPGVHELDIVVAGTGSARLLLDSPPKDLVQENSKAHARLYRRKDPSLAAGGGPAQRRNPEPRKDRRDLSEQTSAQRIGGSQEPSDSPHTIGTKKLKGLGKGRGRSSNSESQPPPEAEKPSPREIHPGGVRWMGNDWVHVASQEIGPDGAADFGGLQGDREYRVVIEYRRVKYQASRGFYYQDGRSISLRTSLPSAPTGSDGKRLRGVVHPIEVFVDYTPPGPEVLGIGFHWRE